MASRASDSNTCFYERDDGLSCRWYLFTPVLQQTFILHCLWGRICTMARHHKPARYPAVARMHATLLETYYWMQMAADDTSTSRDCMHGAIQKVCLCKWASLLKLFPLFEPLEPVIIDILEPLPKSRCGFQFFIVIADRLTELVQVVPLRRIWSVDVAQAIL